jgi:hypothetical protein
MNPVSDAPVGSETANATVFPAAGKAGAQFNETVNAATPVKQPGFIARLLNFLGDIAINILMFLPRQAMKIVATIIPSRKAVQLTLAILAVGVGVYWYAIGFRTIAPDPDSIHVGAFRRFSMWGDQKKTVMTVNRLFAPNQSVITSKGHRYISTPLGDGNYRYEPLD